MFELVEKRQHSGGQPQRTPVSVLVSGIPDPSGDRLSDTGMNQVSELVRSRIVSSADKGVSGPERVSIASAEIAGKEFGVRFQLERSLAEPRIDRGGNAASDAEILRKWWTDPTYTPSGGESMNEVRRRVRDTMNSLASRNLGNSLVVVVAPAVDVIIRTLVLGGDPLLHDWLGCGYASCTSYEYAVGGWSLVMPPENSYLSEPLTVSDSLSPELRIALEGL